METLADRIARDGPINELDAVGWVIRLAKRLEALHALGVAHGSVSAACVQIANIDRGAKGSLVDLQRIKSSLAHHSPERVMGGDLTPADDTWALAVTLYTALAGKPPFEGANDEETRRRILAAAPSPLSVYDVGDDDLQHILERAFVRELGKRMSTAGALRKALEDWHPDPAVGMLPPIDDDESTADDEGAATIMRPAPATYRKSIPVLAEEDDDDARTVAREFVMPGDLAVGAKPRPRPAAGHAMTGPGGTAPLEPVRVPKVSSDDEDDDDDARTRIRNPDEDLDDEDSSDVRTIAREFPMDMIKPRGAAGAAPKPPPAAGAPPDALGPPRVELNVPAAPAARKEPNPDATLALHDGFDLSALPPLQGSAQAAPLAPAPEPMPPAILNLAPPPALPRERETRWSLVLIGALLLLLFVAGGAFVFLHFKLKAIGR